MAGAAQNNKHWLATGYLLLWIFLSAFVIIFNKWILTILKFNFPITLTMWHMCFGYFVTFTLSRFKVFEVPEMTKERYFQSIVPIGVLFACTLWFGNAAYMYLSISFIQMLKALMPAAVYMCSIFWGVQRYDLKLLLVMIWITLGVGAASYGTFFRVHFRVRTSLLTDARRTVIPGELMFNMTGFVFQMSSVISESNRIVLIQKILQSKGFSLNPFTTIYFLSPCVFVCLLFPWLALEASRLVQFTGIPIIRLSSILFLNAISAFFLNCSQFLLIGKTSALTMNVGGVVKDWLLILISHWFFSSSLTRLNIVGYSFAFMGTCLYNYLKLIESKPPDVPAERLSGEKEGVEAA